MKVRYIKDHTDEFEQFFPAGCVAEHSDTEAQARIALGVAEMTNQEAFSRKSPPSAPLPLECVPMDEGINTITKAKNK